MNEVPLNPYPIYTSFEEWQFPHDSLPTSWLALPNAQPGIRQFAASSLTAATIYRDHTCRITNSVEATYVAHVIPVHQLDWFTRNSMERYACDPSEERSVNDLSNTILLLRYEAFCIIIGHIFYITTIMRMTIYTINNPSGLVP